MPGDVRHLPVLWGGRFAGMGDVIVLPVVRNGRPVELPLVDMRLADRTNVADFPLVFCSVASRRTRRQRRSLLDEERA